MVENTADEGALSVVLLGLMKAKGLSPKDLTEQFGIPRSTVGTYLTGRATGARPRKGTIEAFAEALDVDPSDLYAAAEKADARGEQRLVAYYRQLRTEADRAEAIEAVRRILHRRSNG